MKRLCAAALLAALLAAGPATAASVEFCDRTPRTTAAQQDILLRFSAIVKDQLTAAGAPAALVARSGLDLHRLQVRYSHSGVLLAGLAERPWTVRQLYYACDEHKPRVFDQGMAGFLLGTDDADTGYLTLLLLPPEPAAALARAAQDPRQALAVLGATYSANAYPFSTRYQNCNQWVLELLAQALDEDPPDPDIEPRERAQRWLYQQRYAPTVFDLGNPLMRVVAGFVPWLHEDDHPAAELARSRYSVSMPLSLETFVHRSLPDTRRIELCHAGRRVVIHKGWDDIAAGCEPGRGDQVLELNAD